MRTRIDGGAARHKTAAMSAGVRSAFTQGIGVGLVIGALDVAGDEVVRQVNKHVQITNTLGTIRVSTSLWCAASVLSVAKFPCEATVGRQLMDADHSIVLKSDFLEKRTRVVVRYTLPFVPHVFEKECMV